MEQPDPSTQKNDSDLGNLVHYTKILKYVAPENCDLDPTTTNGSAVAEQQSSPSSSDGRQIEQQLQASISDRRANSTAFQGVGGGEVEEQQNNSSQVVNSTDVEDGLALESTNPGGAHVVDATVVENESVARERIELEVRETILKQTLEANVIKEELRPSKTMTCHRNRWSRVAGMFVVLVILGIVLGWAFSGGHSSPSKNIDGNDNPLPIVADETKSTLEIIKDRGYVLCGMNDLSFSRKIDPEVSDQLEGFNVEHCRAIALMALGDANKFKQVWVNIATRFELLANKSIDVITEGTTHTMGRDVMESHIKTAFSFTTPYFYAGLMFAGRPKWVDCAEELESFLNGCRDLRICTAGGSTHHFILLEILGGGVLVPNDSVESMQANIDSGNCNVVAAEAMFLLETESMFGDGEWRMGTKSFSKEPLSHVTRQDDPNWSMMVNLVVEGFILAEAHGISKHNSHEMAQLVGVSALDVRDHKTVVDSLDKTKADLASLFVAQIGQFGNHGDLYEHYIEGIIPRRDGVNSVYDFSERSGLLLSFPFGKTDEVSRGPEIDGTLKAVLHQNTLTCGVLSSRRNKVALDKEVCRGLAASLFGADTIQISYVELQNMTQAYRSLVSGEVDVLAGARVTLQAMYFEEMTGKSFSFSTPYYYDNENHDAFSLMTIQDDPEWADFVNWVVQAVIYATENDITSSNSTLMPVVTLFGEELKSMFWNCISSVGNYEELYNNTIQGRIKRSGANVLNEGDGAQLFPFPMN